MNNQNTDKYYRVSSFQLACFLFAKNLELVNINKIDTKKSEFVFLNSPEREFLVQSFNFSREDAPEVMVDVRKFIMSSKMLKDKLYQNY